MARRHPLFQLILFLCWVSAFPTYAASSGCDVIYPGTDYYSELQSEFYLEDTILVTYINCENLTFFSCWCSDSTYGVAGDNIWKVLDGKGYLGPNATVPIKLQQTGKDFEVGSCGIGLGSTNNTLPWDAVFRLQNKPRPDGPLTFGLDKKVSVTYTGSDYAPFTKLDEVDPYAAYNTVSKPIEAEFATLSSSSSGTTTTTSTTPATPIPQTTTLTQSGVASPTSSTAGANSNDGEGSVPKKGGLSTGAIAGIGVGAAVLVIAIVVLAFFFFWRRRKARLAAAAAAANNAPGGEEEHKKGASYYKAELEDNPKPHGNELDGSNAVEIKEKSHELGPGTERYELGDGGEEELRGRVELP